MANIMKFDDFTWPNNPESLEVTYHHEVDVLPNGVGTWTMQHLGRMGRVIKGEGTFFGTNAYSSFQALAKKFTLATPCVLTIPQLENVNAMLTDLVLEAQEGDNILRYRFTFVETP